MECNFQNSQQTNVQDTQITETLSKIKHKLLVMSGKGGVGKSTVAANIAVFLSNQGYKVGLLDVDLHGPSISGLLGLTGITLNTIGNRIQPYFYNDNLKVLSVQGLLQNPDEAIIWRGPLKIGVIRQFLSDVDWGELDYLIIDSPPGTGDEPLTVAQTIPDCQAVIVTTPQEIALADVRKSLHFCRQIRMPVTGIIENMSGFICPNCNTMHAIFKTGGGEKTASEWGVPFLGRLPIDPGVVIAGDKGYTMDSLSSHTKEQMREIVSHIINNDINTKKGDVKMKIGIPLAGGKLCAHFGHCQQFAILTVENNTIVKREDLTPPPHEPGVIPAWLAQQNVNLVLAGGMGERAQAIFADKGIEVVCGIQTGSPEEIVQAYLNNKLTTGENPCTHDSENHECSH